MIRKRSIQFCQSYPMLCDPMDCSTSGLPVHHQILELTQIHVHPVGDPSNHLILCSPLLLLPSIFPRIRIFSSESVLRITWPNIGASSSASDLPVIFRTFPLRLIGLITFQSKRFSRVFSDTTVQKHQFFSTKLSL